MPESFVCFINKALIYRGAVKVQEKLKGTKTVLKDSGSWRHTMRILFWMWEMNEWCVLKLIILGADLQ